MITREMIETGCEKGYVRLVNNPNDNCVAAQIGEIWFYFAGMDDETLQAEEYAQSYTFDKIVDNIFFALNTTIKDYFEDEYLYYYHYLNEHI